MRGGETRKIISAISRRGCSWTGRTLTSVVTAESLWSTFSYPLNRPDTPAAWEKVVEAALGPRAGPAAEYRFDSPMAPAVAEVTAYARGSFPGGRPVLDALCDFNRRIYKEFRFRSGVTTFRRR